MKRIWHVSSNRWNSAITEYALSSAVALKQAGYRCAFTPLSDSIAHHRANHYGLETYPMSRFDFLAVFKFIGLFLKIKPDVIFVYGGQEATLASLLAFLKIRKIRFVGYRAKNLSWKRWLFKRFDVIVIPCKLLKAHLERHHIKATRVVYLGCDQQVFYRDEKMGSCLKRRPEVIVLARLDPVKGHARFLRLMHRVISSWPDFERRPRVHVIGLPANLSEAEICQAAEDAGLKVGDDVLISAKRMNPIADYLSQAVLGVIPSNGSELICRVAEEFLLCGTPIVVSGVGALEEILFSDEAGASYRGLNDNDAAQLIGEWIQKSLTEGELNKRRRAQLAHERFSLKAMGRELIAILE